MLTMARASLVDDERGRGFPAVLRYGPYLFVSGSDGHRRLDDECVDAALADDAVAQCRNSYGRVARRLEAAGFGGDCAVWIQNFTSGQHWRLPRMALWPEFFGEANHLKAVSFGSQTRMNGVNMLTSVVLAIDPSVERTVAVPSPGRGRASRCTRVGPLTFVIGVRGHDDPITKAHAPEETADSFDAQLDNCVHGLAAHLAADENTLENFCRIDAALRAARFVEPFERGMRRHFGGRLPFAAYAVGTPLGARGEQEIGGIAAAPGEPKSVAWSPRDPTLADTTTAGGLTFVRNTSGVIDEATGRIDRSLYDDPAAQTQRALGNVARLLAASGLGLDRLLRLDVFLRDIYAEDEVLARIKVVLGEHLPALAFIGCEPRYAADVEITAIAAAL
jgi:enamine deaminase RidA (YjgF/YER057c/UK114 family)